MPMCDSVIESVSVRVSVSSVSVSSVSDGVH